MLSTTPQASLSDVYPAGIMRLAQLGLALLAEEKRRVPDKKKLADLEAQLINLRGGLEQAALERDLLRRDRYVSYLLETYGLLKASNDPLLRATTSPLVGTGNMLVPVYLVVNGFYVIVNGFYVQRGAVLAPATAPVYNTPLQPTQTVGTVAYDGLAGTELAFDGPVPTQTSGANFLRLFVGTVQVGRVDFPSTLLGAPFSLFYLGQFYYGKFQSTTDNTLILS